MLRTVLAVLLAVALLAVAAPGIEQARADRTAALVEGELTRIAERATGLAAEETGGAAPARRTVSLSLPDGVAAAPVAYVAIGGVPGCGAARDTAHGDVVAYRLEGGEPMVRHLPVDLRVATDRTVDDDDEPLVLRGDARLRLTLDVRDGVRTVLVERAGGQPTADTPWREATQPRVATQPGGTARA